MHCGLCNFFGSPAGMRSHLRVRCGWLGTTYCSDDAHLPRAHALLHETEGLYQSWGFMLAERNPCSSCYDRLVAPAAMRQMRYSLQRSSPIEAAFAGCQAPGASGMVA